MLGATLRRADRARLRPHSEAVFENRCSEGLSTRRKRGHVCVDPKKERLIYATKDIGCRSGKLTKDLATLSYLREDNLSDLFRNLYGVEPPVPIQRRSTLAIADISWFEPCSQPEKSPWAF